MAHEFIAVVGASLAGMRAAEAIRAAGHQGPLTLIGAEQEEPYERPPLSKGVLQGSATAGSTGLTGVDLDADWLLGTPAAALEPDGREVVLEDGRRVPYDRLVIATGSHARPWPATDGSVPDGVLSVRSLPDALALKERLRPGARVAVVGAGFLGGEIAASAVALGCAVTLVDVASTPMAALGPDVGDFYAALHERNGVRLELDTTVERFVGPGGELAAVVLRNGAEVEADVAVVALGGLPAIDWLRDSGLALADGVVCDATCTVVGRPEIVAAGDVACWPHPLAGGEHVRLEHFSNAQMQGRAAGANLLLDHADRTAFAPLPTFWSDQYDSKLQAVGLPRLAETWTLAEGDVVAGGIVALGVRGGAAVAAVAVDAGSRLRVYRRLIEQGAPVEQVLAVAP